MRAHKIRYTLKLVIAISDQSILKGFFVDIRWSNVEILTWHNLRMNECKNSILMIINDGSFDLAYNSMKYLQEALEHSYDRKTKIKMFYQKIPPF